MHSCSPYTLFLPSSIVTIGAFDGVHLGHQALIRKVVERAKTFGIPAVVYTFDPPPRCYFQKVPMLTPPDEKLKRLKHLKVDYAILARFDEAYLSRSAESFIEELQMLNPVEIWVGRDFRFGRNRAGGLDELSAVFNVKTIDPICCNCGETISSTRIRSLIAAGRLEEARELLGNMKD
ncbi:FAD synthetase [Geobacillus proteiniphilus]